MQGQETLTEDPIRFDAGSPRVERILRDESGVQNPLDPFLGVGPDRREGHPEVVGQVGEHCSLAARVVHARDAAGGGAAWTGEQLHRVRHLVERAHLQHAVGVEERLVGAVLTGERSGVDLDHLLRSLRPARQRP